MSKIKLTGDSSGYVEISAGNAAGNNTLEAPTSGTRLVAHEGTQDVVLGGNLTVNGVLTYEDVTNIDAVGVITARDGIHVTGGSVGIGTDNPDTQLQIFNSPTTGQFKIGGGNGAGNHRVYINCSETNSYIDSYGNNAYRKLSINAAPLLLNDTGGGSVGIGTDNPDATLKVNVASGNNGVVVQNTSTANIALFGARNGDATVQIGQWGSTASGSTFGLSNANLSFIYTTSYSTTHPSALALGTVSNIPIVFATNNTERLRIDPSGRITTPAQPSFFSRPPASYNLSSGGNTIGGTWSDVHNIGSHFSNGTFTAPVAGIYQFDWACFVQSETARIDSYIMVNGTNVMREEVTGYSSTPTNKSSTVHGCYYLSVGDSVTFGVYTQAGTNLYVTTSPWQYASGFLVG